MPQLMQGLERGEKAKRQAGQAMATLYTAGDGRGMGTTTFLKDLGVSGGCPEVPVSQHSWH